MTGHLISSLDCNELKQQWHQELNSNFNTSRQNSDTVRDKLKTYDVISLCSVGGKFRNKKLSG